MEENNQYGQAMTKLLPYGCIKFEQSKFKKDLVVMNQKSRQAATSSFERFF